MFMVYTARCNTLTAFAAFATEAEAIRCAKEHNWKVVDGDRNTWTLTIREATGCKPEYYGLVLGEERKGNNYYDD